MGKSKTINHHEIGRIGADTFENQHNHGMSRALDNDPKTSCILRTIMKVRTHEYFLDLIHGTADKSFVLIDGLAIHNHRVRSSGITLLTWI